MVDATAEVRLVDAVDMQRDGDVVAAVAQAMDVAQALRGGDDLAWTLDGFAARHGDGGVRVPPVVGFGQLALKDLVGTPGLVSVHRAELARAPDQVGHRERTMRIGIGDMPGVGLGAARAQLGGQVLQHVAGIGDAGREVAEQGAGGVHLGGLHGFAQRSQVGAGKLDSSHGSPLVGKSSC
ncbi:hypothetical protein D3C87_1287870 [compost metagenome]